MLSYYNKNRDRIAKKYNKELRRKKYKEVMKMIAQKRKELKDDKESKAGKVCSELSKIFFDSVHVAHKKSSRIFLKIFLKNSYG